MERTISIEERMRRAEEIYNRRRTNNNVRVSTNTVKEKRHLLLYKKIILQIIICLFIYFTFYLIKNSNYIFSDNIIDQTKSFLSYDINFNELYSKIEKYYNMIINSIYYEKNQEKNEDIKEEKNETSEIENNELTEMGIGGGEEIIQQNSNIEETSADEDSVELSQMEIDANNIKNNYNLILPLKGVVSSRFGPRTPTNIVSSNHAGIDIAADEGTVFVASMEGEVTFVSGEGGYGNHIYIQKDDVITIYAHCSKIYVKEGDIIKQGDPIGEVGQTGNATGPHLHFEVRKEDRLVNPELILDFE